MVVEMDRIIEGKVEDATRILAHYLKGSANENEDMRAEIRDIIQSIVSAAVLTVKDDLVHGRLSRRAELRGIGR